VPPLKRLILPGKAALLRPFMVLLLIAIACVVLGAFSPLIFSTFRAS
jgi:hypothetical protein